MLRRRPGGAPARPLMRGLAILAFMLTAASPPAHARTLDGAPIVARPPAGALEGRSRDGIDAFAGIPYAAQPIGPLRWRPPAPAPRWHGVRSAMEFGKDCPQVRFEGDKTPSTQPMGEDCLALNIWRPAGAHKLPVMVWIHGGAFVAGSSASPTLDGADLARRGVVLVSFNYRLGRFGFFAHPALTAEAGGKPHANFAFLDMIAALKWVKANIAALGGDPGNVTIFGESAGGAAVDFLMASPLAKGLFHKAIVQSGANREPYARLGVDRPTRISGEKAGAAFVAQAGSPRADAAVLRAIPADRVQGGLAMWDLQPDRFNGPIIDGRSVVDDPVSRFAAGKVPRIPFIIGSTGAELSQEAFAPALMGLIRGQVDPANLAGLLRAYGDPPEPALIDDYFFGEAARGFARIMHAHGAPTWRYLFDHVTAAEHATRQGANHASELAYLFGTLPDDAAPADRKTARLIGDYWTSFAKTGVPGAPGLPAWPRAGTGDPLLLFRDGAASAIHDGNAARLDAVERTMTARRAREATP